MQSYPYNISQFPDSKVNLDNLNQEIRSSSISVSLYSINSANNVVDIIFNAVLGEKDNNTLDNIVATHDSTPKTLSVLDVNIIPENKKFIEAGDVTNDMYKSESWPIDISSNSDTQIFDFEKPYAISLLSAELRTIEDMITDEMEVLIAPDTVIGVVTMPVTVGDTSINVNDTVSQNLIPGRYLNFDNVEYEVIDVDESNNVITLDKPIITDVTPGSYCFMHIKIISNLYIHTVDCIEIGKSISTGQRIPKNTIIRIKYKNTSRLAKKVAFFVEYLY